jgi:hypothetical protein
MDDLIFPVVLTFIVALVLGLLIGVNIITQTRYVIIDKNQVIESVEK